MIERGDLTAPMQRLVAALSHGHGRRDQGAWVVDEVPGIKFQNHTAEALYDRCLVKITVESRHRRRHKLELTQIGEAVARDIESRRRGHIPESAARLIQEIVEAA